MGQIHRRTLAQGCSVSKMGEGYSHWFPEVLVYLGGGKGLDGGEIISVSSFVLGESPKDPFPLSTHSEVSKYSHTPQVLFKLLLLMQYLGGVVC